MKRVYQYRPSDKVIVGFFETTDDYKLQSNEFEDGSLGRDIIEDRIGKLLYDPATGEVSSRPQADIDTEHAALAKARVQEVLELRSPDGTVWKVQVDNFGVLSAQADPSSGGAVEKT